MTEFMEERESMEQYARDEQELVKAYRSLSKEKRKQLSTYVKMLQEYSGSMDGWESYGANWYYDDVYTKLETVSQ